jgi:hypothetical protein
MTPEVVAAALGAPIVHVSGSVLHIRQREVD